MASCEEFFSQLRSFASTLDKDCHEIKSKIEDDEISTDEEGRSHLVLRGILSDAQQLKKEAVLKSSEMKQMFSFGEFLDVCERLAEHTKTQIEDLQEHLTKYGYKSPGQLPSVDSIYEAVNNNGDKESTSMDTDDTDGFQDNSQSEDDVGAMETGAKSSDEGGHNVQGNDQDKDNDDFMSTPVKPVTFTPMIQATPPPSSTQNRAPKGTQCTPEQSPVPPQTTTPMLKAKPVLRHPDDKGVLSPATHDTPPQPMTFTPLIKTAKHAGLGQGMSLSQPDDDSPLPPVLYTPGIRMMGVPGQQSHGLQPTQCPLELPNDFGTPTPPDLTCTILLKPGDLESQNRQTGRAHTESTEYSTFHPVVEDEYVTLPGYVKTQFSIDDINELLLSIKEFLKLQTEEISRKTLKEEVLREEFCLGRKTKAFMLAIKKLGRAEVTNGELVFTI